MNRPKFLSNWLALAALLVLTLPAAADGPGQAELDQATELQLTAKSLADLEKVINLCESALKKGLDKENTPFAKQLLASTLFQHASRVVVPIFEQTPPNARWQLLRQFALRDLEGAIKHNNDMGEAHLLIAKLHALPGGDTKRGYDAAGEAIRAYKDDKPELSKAHVLRAAFATDAAKKLADYEEAIKADPSNTEAWQARAGHFLAQGNFEKAVGDLHKLLENNTDNLQARLALAEALANLEKFDEALQQVGKVIEQKPEASLSYTLRARIHLLKDDKKAALADVEQALKLEPQDLQALMMRARLRLVDGDSKLAREDIDKVLQLRPGLTQAMLLRSVIRAEEGKYPEAIRDLEAVLKADPKNAELRMQLARYYVADQRPRKAIEILGAVIQEDGKNWMALRTRGDTYLGIGKHAEAVADYDKALQQEEAAQNSGLLNNLGWVLATSPNDKVRDGKRSIEFATKACEATKYKEAHILSTLAASYAEAGDFEAAVKWSTKAVESGREGAKEQLEQLEKELESYKQKKPWRELQQTEDKPDPIKPAGDVLET